MSIRKIKRRKMRAMGSTSLLRIAFGADMAQYLLTLSQSELNSLVDAAIKHAMRR